MKRNTRKDFLRKEQISYRMSQVKSKDTKVELLVRSTLFAKGYRFRKNVSKLPGKPDIVFLKQKLVIFIDGDFWHGKKFSKWSGKLNVFWYEKIKGNIQRDKRNRRRLKSLGWKVVRIWESDINKCLPKEVSKIEKALAAE
jgi:DNA mismatch endonuclease (patch repair protein)